MRWQSVQPFSRAWKTHRETTNFMYVDLFRLFQSLVIDGGVARSRTSEGAGVEEGPFVLSNRRTINDIAFGRSRTNIPQVRVCHAEVPSITGEDVSGSCRYIVRRLSPTPALREEVPPDVGGRKRAGGSVFFLYKWIFWFSNTGVATTPK